jgi:hypothetical protein
MQPKCKNCSINKWVFVLNHNDKPMICAVCGAEVIEPLTRTIREVRIGDVVFRTIGSEYEVVDVGQKGFVDEDDEYWSFERADSAGWKIKQLDKKEWADSITKATIEKLTVKEIEIAEELSGQVWRAFTDTVVEENRKLIIELQKAVNKISKQLEVVE